MAKEKAKCEAEGCDRFTEAQGLCKKHYLKWRLTQITDLCKIEGCGKREFSTGLCRGHYARKQRKSPVNGPLLQHVMDQDNVYCRLPKDAIELLAKKASEQNMTAPQLHRKLLMNALGVAE